MAFSKPDFSGTEALQERSRVVVPRAAAWPQHLKDSPEWAHLTHRSREQSPACLSQSSFTDGYYINVRAELFPVH